MCSEYRFDDLVYYQFDRFLERGQGLVHGCFTRLGGVSRPPWQSLNTGHTVGDDLEHVRENHERICRALDIRRADMVSPHQVHSAVVRVVDARIGGRVCEQTDALITDTPECVPDAALCRLCAGLVLRSCAARGGPGARRLAWHGGGHRARDGSDDGGNVWLPSGGHSGGDWPVYWPVLL